MRILIEFYWIRFTSRWLNIQILLTSSEIEFPQEKLAFVDWINFRLAKDPLLVKLGSIPISEEGEALFKALKDGIIMK